MAPKIIAVNIIITPPYRNGLPFLSKNRRKSISTRITTGIKTSRGKPSKIHVSVVVRTILSTFIKPMIIPIIVIISIGIFKRNIIFANIRLAKAWASAEAIALPRLLYPLPNLYRMGHKIRNNSGVNMVHAEIIIHTVKPMLNLLSIAINLYTAVR